MSSTGGRALQGCNGRPTWMGDRLLAGKPSQYRVTGHLGQLNHPPLWDR